MAFKSLFFILILSLFSLIKADLTIQVEPKTTDCFIFQVDSIGKKYKLNYFITRGGLLDLELIINTPDGANIFRQLVYEKNVHYISSTQVGDYEVCWGNEMSRFTAKVVTFSIQNEYETAELVTQEHVSDLNRRISKIDSNLMQVKNDQRYLRVREQKHRDTADSTNSRIQWYSMFESAVLLIISIGQVFYLKKFFEIKKI